MKIKRLPGGVWSAAPTAFTARMELDQGSLDRMLEHDRRLGINGYFIAGTNGEGPWMTNGQRRQLVEFFARQLKGQVPLAAQVTDNSAARMLDNIAMVRDAGADIAVIAPPHFVFNTTSVHVRNIYLETIRRSPLPVGIYDRGPGALGLTPAILAEICAEPRVVLVKDSSADLKRMRAMLALRRRRPGLTLLSGWEFNCIPYLQAGYDGLLLGGGVFNGFLAHQVLAGRRETTVG
ncbi:MAG: dihydrodipicolinate synthase family protein [Lentisphaerae bacterium]|nr:dihydrodipicolinate synthase family protein [Lentisphaerota bacterium]